MATTLYPNFNRPWSWPLLPEETYVLSADSQSMTFAQDQDMAWADVESIPPIEGPVANFDRTDGAGGTAITFVSGRLTTGFTLAGTVSFGFYGRELTMNDNVGLTATLGRLDPQGVITNIPKDVAGIAFPWDDGVEMSTSNTAMAWSGTPYADIEDGRLFREDDRIFVQFSIKAAGGTPVIGSKAFFVGGRDTIDPNIRWLNRPENFIQITETVTFKSEPLIPVSGLLLGLGP